MQDSMMGSRYTVALCGKGGCGLCGFTPLSIGALHLASIAHMHDPVSCFNRWSKDLYVDEKLILARMQLTEILLLVDFIHKKTADVDSVVKCEFAAYLWNLVGTWKINGVTGYNKKKKSST